MNVRSVACIPFQRSGVTIGQRGLRHNLNTYFLKCCYRLYALHGFSTTLSYVGTLTQPVNGSAAFSTFENGRRKMSLGIFNTLAGLSFDKSSSSDSSRRSSSPEVPIYDQVKRPCAPHEWLSIEIHIMISPIGFSLIYIF